MFTPENQRKLDGLDKLTQGWSINTLRHYLEHNTQLADELEAHGLDATTTLETAALYAELIVQRGSWKETQHGYRRVETHV